MEDVDRVLVLYGDVPLTESATLQRLLDEAVHSSLGLMTARLSDPTGYGRIVRDAHGRLLRSVEQKDATEAELDIDEINTGILVADRRRLGDWLGKIGNDNAQREYYLTDVIALAAADGVDVATCQPSALEEVCGVNDRVHLAALERYYQRGQAEKLMREGVTLADPNRFDIRGRVHTGIDVSIDVNVVIEGEVRLADGVSIGPNCLLRDCEIGPDTQVFSNCVIDNARVGSNARIGPYSRLRPEAILSNDVHVGNFVEVKKSLIGLGSKVNHLTYIGDARIGSGVNVGAGTITCNYDGVNKHLTKIGDKAFIGSNASLVAPVDIGEGATVGAGSVIAGRAPAGKLTVTRARQITLDGWRRPRKKPGS
jgi:bifunctional UDP-N-acetylglucosamine pyrophosphorylase/glucosamine-1-phosphate N-acetyltransferase